MIGFIRATETIKTCQTLEKRRICKLLRCLNRPSLRHEKQRSIVFYNLNDQTCALAFAKLCTENMSCPETQMISPVIGHKALICARLWFPGKGTRNMAPQVPGLFYSTKLQSSLAWWKQPLNFDSKKVVRYIELESRWSSKRAFPMLRNLQRRSFRPARRRFCDSRSAQGQTNWGLSRPGTGSRAVSLQVKRVHTPPGKGKQRIVHALCSLNEATVLLIACSSFEEASQAS